jgi:alpha-beta hydrolase superfamily lysophospholipase
VPVTSIHTVEADGVRVFYRAADNLNSPVVLLLNGFPASSFMFRELIPRLAHDYRVIAPDLPGFGFTEVPAERKYVYSFDRSQVPATSKLFNLCLRNVLLPMCRVGHDCPIVCTRTWIIACVTQGLVSTSPMPVMPLSV